MAKNDDYKGRSKKPSAVRKGGGQQSQQGGGQQSQQGGQQSQSSGQKAGKKKR